MLCKHNPAKRCTGNFAHKYWVGDKLLAKCEGAILVELIDADTGERCDDVAGMRIEARPLCVMAAACGSTPMLQSGSTPAPLEPCMHLCHQESFTSV